MKRHLVTIAMALAVAGIGSPVFAAPILAIDMNDRTAGDPTSADPNNTAPGFSPFLLGGSGSQTSATGTVGGFDLTLTVFDADGATGGVGAMDDRDRSGPTGGTPLDQLYDDFVFVGNSAGDIGGGLDIAIDSNGLLAASTRYIVSIYAYDDGAATAVSPRAAAWTDGNNAGAPVLTTSFLPQVDPLTSNTYKFTGLALTDANGNLLLHGRDITAGDVALYVNGLEINAIPEPVSLGLALAAVAMLGFAPRRR